MILETLLARSAAVLLLFAASVAAIADVPTFRITQVFSNLDGSVQFVELTEYAGLDGQHRFAGLTLTTTHGDIEKTYTFPHDLPTDRTAHTSVLVAASENRVLAMGALFGFGVGYLCCYKPTFADVPLRFLRAGPATLDFAGADRITYDGLPTDGLNAWYRDGPIRRGTAPGLSCPAGLTCPSRLSIAQSFVYAVEYHDAVRDHYFMTALAEEIDALDTGRTAGWVRTGEAFRISAAPNSYPGVSQAVCRLYIAPGAGDSHFFSAWADECAAAQAHWPQITLETDAAFHVLLPDLATGVCPPLMNFDLDGPLDAKPLYRLWNQRADSNHRYTTSLYIRGLMISQGYVSEGFGPEGVSMCVP
jgi:hypothetical protein